MPIPLIHQTDLFRPHADPDDHWDLACVYALAARGHFDLKGVLIDAPPHPKYQPDVLAVAQMNSIHGLSAPVVVGSAIPMERQTETQADAPPQERGGVAFILRTLREASEPVLIQIVGSCRDVALAANLEPALFREKCRAIYLNAGTGKRDVSPDETLEYNVAVNAQSYAAIFDAPCPIYWLPCFGEEVGVRITREYGTWYQFQQKDILSYLPPPVQNYFAYMLGRFESSGWYSALHDDLSETLRIKGEDWRDMWCTAGILDMAGMAATNDGRVIGRDSAAEDRLYTFEPIEVTCDDRGITTWRSSDGASNRMIFHIDDPDAYEVAMPKAMRALLAGT